MWRVPKPYIAVTLQADTDILSAISSQVARTPKLMNTALKRGLPRFKKVSKAWKRITAKPPRPKYPLRWKSARQRRFVMAKLRRENNLPYQPTGELLKAYDLLLDTKTDNGVLTLVNKSPIARFVVGDDAQPMFVGRWTQYATEIVPIQNELNDFLVETFFTVADPFIK